MSGPGRNPDRPLFGDLYGQSMSQAPAGRATRPTKSGVAFTWPQTRVIGTSLSP